MTEPNKLPADFLESLKCNRVVGVIGAGLSLAAGLPSWQRLLELLIAECENQLVSFSEGDELRALLENRMFFEVAEECKSLLGNSLFRDFMRRIFRPPNLKPSNLHRMLPNIPFRALLTTNYDCLLEQTYALVASSPEFLPVYTQKNVAELSRIAVEERPFLLKMHGHIDDPETLILSSKDYSDLIHINPAFRAALSAIIASRVMLFIGYGLRDPDLELLLSQHVSIFNAFGQRHFALVPDPSPVLCRSMFRKFNVSVIPYSSKNNHMGLQVILSSLVNHSPPKAFPSKEGKATPSAKIAECPYKFLDYYDSQDADVFFGRNEEVVSILQAFLSKKLLVLFGRSGVGKTSLIKASLIPELTKRSFFVLYMRLARSTFQSILVDLASSFGSKLDYEEHTPEQIARQFTQMFRATSKPVAIILDAFEDLFSSNSQGTVDNVGRFIGELIRDDLCELRVLISLKQESFVDLNDFTVAVPSIFNNRFQLDSLTLNGARSAIIGPAQAAGIQCEKEFVDLAIHDLDREGIEPAQLQLVCTAMFNGLSPNERVMSLSIYERLGGAPKILSGYIGYVLSSFRDEDRDIARILLKSFVNSSGIAVTVPPETLLSETSESCSNDKAQEVIDTLIFHRLLRIVLEESRTYYELVHDFLVPNIAQWISEEERETRKVQEVMENERNVCRHLGTIIPLDRARFLRENEGKITFTEADYELIEQSIKQGEELEESAQRRNEKLRISERLEALGTLARGISHDFLNLLLAAQGNAQIALERIDAANSQETANIRGDLEQIQKAILRGQDLVHQILSFSRVEPPKKVTVVPEKLLHEVFDLLLSTIPENISFEIECPNNVGPIEGDPSQFVQILLNLILNALGAMPNGGNLKVSMSNFQSDGNRAVGGEYLALGDMVVIEVKDDGIGIDKSKISKIFDPFFTTKEVDGKTGLGLAVVHGIVTKHEGKIEVESKVGKGTTFRIFLPKAKLLVSEKNTTEYELSFYRGTEGVLVVEDDIHMRNMISRTLLLFGYKPFEAEDGEDAIEIFSNPSNRIDIVVMDVTMPKLSGPEVAKKMRTIRQDAKIILMSAYAADESQDMGENVCSIFLSKPFYLKGFLGALRGVLDASKG